MDVLRADWSLLTQPARLDKLSKVYERELALKTTEAKQIVRLSELPERPLTIEDLVSESTDLAAVGADPVTTGAVAQ